MISIRNNVRERSLVLLVNKYTMSALARLLRNWLEHRPSNNGDFNYSVTGNFGTVYYNHMALI